MALVPAPEFDQLDGEFGGDVLPDRNDFERYFGVQSRLLAQRRRCGLHAYFFAGVSRLQRRQPMHDSQVFGKFQLLVLVGIEGGEPRRCRARLLDQHEIGVLTGLYRTAAVDIDRPELLPQPDIERDRALHVGVAGLEFLQRQRLVLVGIQRAEDGLGAGLRLRLDVGGLRARWCSGLRGGRRRACNEEQTERSC